MKSQRVLAALVAVVLLLAGWFAGGAGQAVQAQTETVPAPQTPVLRNCHFYIPGVYLDGRRVLLDECTGDTWRFDSGWNSETSSYDGLPTWRPIEME